jgi:imidazolonepropionase-like amidohydrolase
MAFKSEGDPLNDDPFLNEILAWRNDVQFAEMPQHCSKEIYQKLLDVYSFYEGEEYKLKENKDIRAYNTRLTTRGICNWEKNIRRLIEADAVLGVGNDSGVPFIFPGMIHLEMEHLVRFGMSPAQALRAGTLVNARICRVDKDCGAIEQGKQADLVLLAGNPLEKIQYAGQVQAVFKKGRLVSKAEGFDFSAT